MIFKWANAILHDEFLSSIPSDIDRDHFFSTITKECGLLFNQYEDTKTELHGSWLNIVKAEKILQKYSLEWESIKIKLNTCDNLSRAVGISDCTEVVNDVYDGSQNLQQSEAVSNKESKACFQDEFSGLIGEQMYVTDTGATFIGKIKENLQMNHANVEKKGIIEKGGKNGKEKEVEELYMNITVSSKKVPTTRSDTFSWDESERDLGENPLDKLCQLLQIDEEEGKDKRLLEANKKQKYEENFPYKHFCSHCSFKTKRQNQYLKHMQLHNKPQKLFMCSQCEFKTIRLSTLRKHELTHNPQQLLNCEICPYKTDDAKLFTKHLKTKHIHKCSHCDFIAHSMKEARKHFHITHKPNKPPSLWKCEKCPYKSRLRAHLQRHTNDVHGSLRPFLCQYCGKCFKRHDTLKQHKVIHGEINPSHTCTQCNKICSSASQLKEHMTVHTVLRPFLCEHCGASFKTKSIQRKHVKTLHSLQDQFQCDMCTRSFRGKTNLTRHMKTHKAKPEEEVLQLAIPEIAMCETVNQDNIPVVLEINNTPLKIEVLYSNIGTIIPKQKEI